MESWPSFGEIAGCRKCPRLVAHREAAAQARPPRFADWEYWSRPVPSFGDPGARLLVVGLAPAAHGANRTGRMFTGDRSGEWLYRALHHAGFASQAASTRAGDGLVLRDCLITAAAHCAPPDNKPTPEELARCRPYLVDELRRLRRLEVVVCLGKLGFEAYLKARRELGREPPQPRPRFAHASLAELPEGVCLIGSYHPSQQNTFTGRLTRPMLDEVFRMARERMGL